MSDSDSSDGEAPSCSVCCEAFRNRKGDDLKKVTCPGCQYEACVGCIKTYLLGSTQQAHCMGCKLGWKMSFLVENFKKTFINGELKAHYKKILIAREKAFLPGAQAQAEQMMAAKMYREVVMKHREFTKYNRTVTRELRKHKAGSDEYKLLMKEFMFAQEQMQECLNLIQERGGNLIGGSTVRPVNEKARIFKCPAEECRGYITDSPGEEPHVCPLCQQKVCRDCLVVMAADHECDENDIESVKTILKETRACPSCSAPVSKISGCSQIWCTICHTAFDYNTGQIDKGTIHNPHYVEYQQKLGRDPYAHHARVPVVDGTNTIYAHPRVKLDDLMYSQAILRQVRDATTRIVPRDFLGPRVEYLTGDITEEKWQTKVEQYTRFNERDEIVRQLLTTFADRLDAIYHEVVNLMGAECLEYQQLFGVTLTAIQKKLVQKQEKFVAEKKAEILAAAEGLNQALREVARDYGNKLDKYLVKFDWTTYEIVPYPAHGGRRHGTTTFRPEHMIMNRYVPARPLPPIQPEEEEDEMELPRRPIQIRPGGPPGMTPLPPHGDYMTDAQLEMFLRGQLV